MLVVIIIFCLFILFVVIQSSKEIKSFTVTNYYIETGKVNSNYKFVVLTDLHNRLYGNNNDNLIGAIEDIAPDKIFIIGDMINKKDAKNVKNTMILLTRLAMKYQIIYINGNHEQVIRDKEKDEYITYKNNLQDNGIIFLKNEVIQIDESIDLYGLEIDLNFYKHYAIANMDDNYIESKLGNSQGNKYNILLTHSPNYFDNYQKWGANLVVSGHNHGGAINIPYIGGVISPQCILFPKYYAGHFKQGSGELLVSRGIGSHSVNIRVFNRPEIMVINIKNSN